MRRSTGTQSTISRGGSPHRRLAKALRPCPTTNKTSRAACHLSNLSTHFHVDVVEQEARPAGYLCDLTCTANNAPERRHWDSVMGPVVETVMGRNAARDVGNVVHSAQQQVGAKIEFLHLGMSRHAIGIDHLEHAPVLVILSVLVQFARHEIRVS